MEAGNGPGKRTVHPGQRFGKLEVIDYSGKDSWGKWNIKLKCDCGSVVKKSLSNLLSGRCGSCGVCERITKRTLENLVGNKFGRLSVLSFSHSDKNHSRIWNCRCDCGNELKVMTLKLKSGHTKSCGCFRRDRGKKDPTIFGLNLIYRRTRDQAKTRGINFDLSLEDYKTLTKQNCYYCGSTPSMVSHKAELSQYVYNGVDRKNALLGYNVENCVPCCKQCNYTKLDYSEKEFVDHIYKIHEYQQRRQNET